ncbi:MlrC-like protein [Mesorhizobium plurifarium]|uniref:Microcystinase C n=1 Tax=Mesorhizobium plurifarium TaxID=69974 RepID=A0A0K2VU84_MESPL|nr:MlrC-like protein [Mesorhizobium plurifarium]
MIDPATFRIAIGSFVHETNTFSSTPTTLADFVEDNEMCGMLRGEKIFAHMREGNNAIAGFLSALASSRPNWQPVPTLWAAAYPSGAVPRSVFEPIVSELVERIADAEPLDAVFLDLHGAMFSEDYPDGEGEILRRVRQAVGAAVPIVAALDPHGNISKQMVEISDVLIAYRTYPHVDMAETGSRVFGLLERILVSGHKPFKAFRQLDFLIPPVFQSTMIEPNVSILNRMLELERETLSISYCPGFPSTDFPDCRPSVFAYAEDEDAAQRAVDELVTLIHDREPEFAGRLYQPAEAVEEALRIAALSDKPVIIADIQDNPGAGASSDTTGMLRALIVADVHDAALGLLCDPTAAEAAHRAGPGATIQIALGGKSGIPADEPLHGEFIVEAVSNGEVVATGPVYDGWAITLGAAACLRIGGVRVAVCSTRMQMLDTAFFRAVGIEPKRQKILVVKDIAHFRADFTPIASEIIPAISPGAMVADPSALPWKNLTPGVRMKPLGPVFVPFVT